MLRGYWFKRPPGPGLLRRIEEVEAHLEGAAPQSGMERAKDDLSAIKRAVEWKDAVYALSLEPMLLDGEPMRFPFLLQSPSLLGAFVHCRETALARGGVCLAAGSSRVLKLASDQRLLLRMVLQRALEAERAVSVRVREVSFFMPRRGEKEPLWSAGLGVSVLGRVAPVASLKDAARLLVVL